MARFAVKISIAGQKLRVSRGGTADPQSCFDSRRATVIQLHAGKIAGKNLLELFQQLEFHGRREIMTVHQLPGCLLNRFSDFWMTMPEGGYINTG